MNEAETRAELIDPALRKAGWGVVDGSRVRREMIAPGRLQGAGKRSKQEIADYVLFYRNQKLAVIEAKRSDLSVTEGVTQAKTYAEKLLTRFTYSTNGVGIYEIDMHTGAENHVHQYPTPEVLWERTFGEANDWHDRFSAIPFEDKSVHRPSFQVTLLSRVSNRMIFEYGRDVNATNRFSKQACCAEYCHTISDILVPDGNGVTNENSAYGTIFNSLQRRPA
jgi:type I site-specific restriction endonuclease